MKYIKNLTLLIQETNQDDLHELLRLCKSMNIKPHDSLISSLVWSGVPCFLLIRNGLIELFDIQDISQDNLTHSEAMKVLSSYI